MAATSSDGEFCWPCGKDLYASEDAAKRKIRQLAGGGHHRRRRAARSVYPCPNDKTKWHLSGNQGKRHSGREDRFL